LCFFSFVSIFWAWKLPLLNNFTSRLLILHYLLLLFTLLNWALTTFEWHYWTACSAIHPVIRFSRLSWFEMDLVTLDSTSLELSLTGSTLVESFSDNWNFASNTNTTALNFFLLGTTHHHFGNVFHLGAIYTLIIVYLELPWLPCLHIVFTLSFIILSWAKLFTRIEI
jgi:hypothetical protein